MREEPRERLARSAANSRVENKEFWEIIDRGRNFEYMPPEQRACLQKFFDWLNSEGATNRTKGLARGADTCPSKNSDG